MTPQDLLNETQATLEADIAKRNQLSQKIQQMQNEFNQLAININASITKGRWCRITRNSVIYI